MKSLVCYFCLLMTASAELNVEGLEKEIRYLEKHALGVDDLQKDYDQLLYDSTKVDGPNMLKTITQNLGTKFDGLFNAADRIREEVKKNYKDFPSKVPDGLQECCMATGVEQNLKFLSMVKTGAACVTESATSPENRKFPDSTIEKTMKENNDKNPDLLWQYFGSEEGTSIYYPKVKVDSCSRYDPRFRPFYASAATPGPKDVVIVIDTSGSMNTELNGDSRLSIAKEAARTVINTLSPQDRIGIVAFSNSATTPSDCYSSTLAIATDQNKNKILEFSNNLGTAHKSDFAEGLRKAFDYYYNSAKSVNGESRNSVILFMTDTTEYNGDDPLVVIKEKNHPLNNSVIIMTYGIGMDEKDDTNSLLKDMSKQTKNNPDYGNIRVGLTTYIKDPTNLRSKLGAYYSYFRQQTTKGIITEPFVDTFSNIGLILSVCVPVYGDSDLLGVACADMKLFDLFSEVTVFGEGEYTYVFIIDKTGHTLKHPLLQLPRTIKTNHPLIDISFLERTPAAQEVITSMKAGKSGNKTLESIRTVARGVVIQEGIQTKTVPSHYYWAPVPNSDYSVCVVVGDGDRVETLRSQTPKDNVFLYHLRRLWKKDTFKDCKHFLRRTTKESSTIQFNPSAFVNPSIYLDRDETENDVQNYYNYFTGKSQYNPGFKPNVFNSIVASHSAETFWKANTDADHYVIWRYFGTLDGFIRAYPGVELLKDYDHQLRACGQPNLWLEFGDYVAGAWPQQDEFTLPGHLSSPSIVRGWRRTISQKGTLVITAPYNDAWGSGFLISLLKTVYKGSSKVHTTADEIEGVIGSDVPLTYMNRVVVESNPICNKTGYSCMLIDVSGFVVIHPDFVTPFINGERHIEGVHIVSKEPEIASDLMSEGVLERKSCADFDNLKTQYTYRIRLPTGKSGGINKMNTANYELKPVAGTNIFMIMKKVQQGSTGKCCKQFPMHASDSWRCSDDVCECLCYKPVLYNSCTVKIDLRDESPTCIAKTPDTSAVSFSDDVDNIQPCFDPKCSTRKSNTECYRVSGCSWCVRNKAGNIFNNQCCRSRDTCEFGIVPSNTDTSTCKVESKPPDDNEPEDKSGPNDESNVVGPVAGALGCVVLILLIVIFVLIFRKRFPRHQPIDDYLTAIPEVPATLNAGSLMCARPGTNISDEAPPSHHSDSSIRYVVQTPDRSFSDHSTISTIPHDPNI